MYERSLNESERILATHKDVVVPVKEIWLEVSKQGQLQRFEVPTLIDFTTLLEGDERFEFIPVGDELGDEYVDPADDDEIEYAADMERLGFYSEDRVRLRNIEVSEELTGEVTEEPEEPSLNEGGDDAEHTSGAKTPSRQKHAPSQDAGKTPHNGKRQPETTAKHFAKPSPKPSSKKTKEKSRKKKKGKVR
ncbi:MAG TPA: hypothetical protein VII11_12265 [Bacteroidota bacterium]